MTARTPSAAGALVATTLAGSTAATLLAAILAGSAGAPAAAASGGGSTPTRALGSATSTSSVGRAPHSSANAYLAVTDQGTRSTALRVVDKTSGKVLKTLATMPWLQDYEAFRDAQLGADGTAWVSVCDPKDPIFGASLRRFDTRGRARTVLTHVTNVRISPDGRKLAVTTDGPDDRRRTKGTEALRVVDIATGRVRTLARSHYTMDIGRATYDGTIGLQVRGWLDNARIVVRTHDKLANARIAVVSASRPSQVSTWKSFRGNTETDAIGRFGSKGVLVTAKRRPTDERGLRAYRISPTTLRGTLVARDDTAYGVADVVDQFLTKTRATPFVIGTRHFPYRGPGTVSAAYL